MKPLTDPVRQYLRDAPICRIASVLPDGGPHVSPVCPVFDDDVMYIDVSHVGGTAKGIASDPRICVLIDDYYDDWSKLRGAILYTRAREIDGDIKDHIWRLLREKFPQSPDAGWNPRLTLALDIEDYKAWGLD